MAELVIEDLRHEYRDLLEWIIKEGSVVSPRGQKTIEVHTPTIRVMRPERCLLTDTGRKINTRLLAWEALQLVGGFSDPGAMVAVAPRTAEYLDGGIFHGAYGPRLRAQLPLVVRRLRSDPDTRQAAVNIFRGVDDLMDPAPRDVPCTLDMVFTIREDRLQLTVNMRSSDAIMGIPYDFAQFNVLQQSVAALLELRVGELTHRPVSLHVYERDLMVVDAVTQPTAAAPDLFGIEPIGRRTENVMQRARDIAYGAVPPDANATELWLAKRAAG